LQKQHVGPVCKRYLITSHITPVFKLWS